MERLTPMRTGSPRSIFAKMPLADLLSDAKCYPTRAAYLQSLGIIKRDNMGLSKRMTKEGLTHFDIWPNPWANAHRRPSDSHTLDLSLETHAYFFGLAMSDGHLRTETRNRGNLTIELNSGDEEILLLLARALPWPCAISRRTRQTNFGQNDFTAARWCSLDLRTQLIDRGFPVGKKAHKCVPPNKDYDEYSFWRGVLDGDGSLGVDTNGIPFVSLVTASSDLADAYKAFLKETIGYAPTSSKNTRDGVWNIMISRQWVTPLVSALYSSGCLSIARKAAAAELCKASFIRPKMHPFAVAMAGSAEYDPFKD